MPPPEAQCPFLKQVCIKERCQLYMEMPVVEAGPLVGTVKAGGIRGCSINITAHFLRQLDIKSMAPRVVSRERAS